MTSYNKNSNQFGAFIILETSLKPLDETLSKCRRKILVHHTFILRLET